MVVINSNISLLRRIPGLTRRATASPQRDRPPWNWCTNYSAICLSSYSRVIENSMNLSGKFWALCWSACTFDWTPNFTCSFNYSQAYGMYMIQWPVSNLLICLLVYFEYYLARKFINTLRYVLFLLSVRIKCIVKNHQIKCKFSILPQWDLSYLFA